MQSSHHDLSMGSYVLIGFLAICQEAVGLRTALILALILVFVWAVLSPLIAHAAELRKTWPARPCPPKRVGRGR